MKTCLFIVAIEFCLFDCLFLGGLLVDCCLIRELLGQELGVLRKSGGQRPFHLPWLGWWPLPPLQTDLIRANDKPEHKLIKKKTLQKKKINVCTHPTLRWFTSPSNFAKTNGARDGKQTNKKVYENASVLGFFVCLLACFLALISTLVRSRIFCRKSIQVQSCRECERYGSSWAPQLHAIVNDASGLVWYLHGIFLYLVLCVFLLQSQ